MAQQEVTRKYAMGDGSLIQRADALANTMKRDKDDLAKRGITPERAATLNDARDAFSEFPTDDELKADVGIAAEAKKLSRYALEIAIRDIRGMAITKFGEGTPRYKAFGFEGLTNMQDNNLVRCGRKVWRTATRYMGLLESEGLTDETLTMLLAKTDTFDKDIDMVEAAVEERDHQTQTRVTLGNALFDRVSEFAKTGQQYWADKDEAKHNDYIIYDKPDPAEPEAPQS